MSHPGFLVSAPLLHHSDKKFRGCLVKSLLMNLGNLEDLGNLGNLGIILKLPNISEITLFTLNPTCTPQPITFHRSQYDS